MSRKSERTTIRRVAGGASIFVFVAGASAHPGPRFWIGVEAGRIATYQQSGPDYVYSQVFTQPLEEIVPGIWTTDFPGYEVRTDGGGVATNTVFGYKLAGPLLKYNANTLQEMTIPGGTRLAVSDESEATVISSTGVLPGFNFLNYTGTGAHAHLFYTLYGDGTEPGGGTDGVYVLPLQLTSPSYTASDWFFLVLPRNASAADISATQSLTQQMADAMPGDANFDGVVNANDFTRLATNFGTTGKWWKSGDFNFDGIVNANDFTALASNFGLSNAGANVASVPEPRAISAVVAMTMLGSVVARRRKLES